MCVYSAIADYGKTIPLEQWTPPAWDQFKRVLEEAEDFDVQADQPDCESEEKTAWMKEVEDRLASLEDEHEDLDAPLTDDLPDDVAPWAESVEDRLAALEEVAHPQGVLVDGPRTVYADSTSLFDRKIC